MPKKLFNFSIALLAVLFLVPNLAQGVSTSTTDNFNECDGVLSTYPMPEVELNKEDSGIVLKWDEIEHPDLKGYKVVISRNNPNPRYSEDGYLAWITNRKTTSYLIDNSVKYKNGDFGGYLEPGQEYYFSITAVYECGKVAGNAVKAAFYQAIDNSKDDGDDSSDYKYLKDKKEFGAPIALFVKTKNKEKIKIKYKEKHRENEEDREEIERKIKEKVKMLKENRLDDILSEVKELRSVIKEQQVQIKYLRGLVRDLQKVASQMQSAIQSFIAYGVDENTKYLGEGERAAVIYSFKQAFGRLPSDETELEDVIKIANGYWPSKRSLQAEQRALEKFQRIYKRLPDFNNPNDNAAITIMAYGLRQRAVNRNLQSEQKGLAIYQSIFGKLPETTEDWNVMQAITYSGAKR